MLGNEYRHNKFLTCFIQINYILIYVNIDNCTSYISNMENTIRAPFAARDYNSHTHIKKITDIPSGNMVVSLGKVIRNAVSGYIEPLWNGMTRIISIEEK